MSLYCGIDFHKNTSSICLIAEDGSQVQHATVKTTRLRSFLVSYQIAKIGIESSGGTNHMVDILKADGHDVRIINSNTFKAIGLGGKKTDKRDAEAIAQAMRVNFVPEVFHKSKRAREIKSLLVCRELCVNNRVSAINHVRGTLREYGITIPQGFEKFLELASSSIESLENGCIKSALRGHLEHVHKYMKDEKEIEAAIAEFTKGDERLERLRSIPGVGPLGSYAALAVIDEVSRFSNSKQLASYLGLVPKEHSSGGTRMMGSITRSGSEIMRRYLIHGARAILMHAKENDPDPNKRWALRLKDKVGMNKATVALAHRMARLIWCILKENRKYSPKPPLAKTKKRILEMKTIKSVA